MEPTTILIVLLIAGIIIAVFCAKKDKHHKRKKREAILQPQPQHYNKAYLYQKRTYLLTVNENSLYIKLRNIADELKLEIFAKVRLADIIEPKRGSQNWKASFTKIRSKHVDFLLCEKLGIKSVLVIELDDYSHSRPDRKARDEFVDQALGQAGIPILHVKNSKDIEEKIRHAITYPVEPY